MLNNSPGRVVVGAHVRHQQRSPDLGRSKDHLVVRESGECDQFSGLHYTGHHIKTATGRGLPSTSVAGNLETACARIRSDLIGRLTPVETPFGRKPLVYADWTASGRSVRSIENFMSQEVLPLYGNTHTTTSATGAQTTAYREQARRTIADAVNAKVSSKPGDADVVLFVGSGATAAVNKLVSTLSLNKKVRSWKRSKDKPVVFVGPYDHHSNILPWRESCADVVQIAEDSEGGVDCNDLLKQLKTFAYRPLKIGSFAAASNVTGALEDVDKITRILHKGGALAFWDYATAAPYIDVDMNPAATSQAGQALVAKDAVFFSGHKFLGGPGTPGVLVAKKWLFDNNAVPVAPGGGTVLLVSKDSHTYVSNVEEREEGGTPDILGSIRLGLVFQLKQGLGNVEAREEELTKLGLRALRSNPRVVVLGDTGRKRLPIFSFLIKHGDRFLHHNFVCALLNDVFGVQARAGCSCAGPYGISLLGLPDSSLPKVKKKLLDGVGIIKPGFSRFSLTFFMSDAEANYILAAVNFVADQGESFLPLYEPDVATGEWKCKSPFTPPLSLSPSGKSLSKASIGFFFGGNNGDRAAHRSDAGGGIFGPSLGSYLPRKTQSVRVENAIFARFMVEARGQASETPRKSGMLAGSTSSSVLTWKAISKGPLRGDADSIGSPSLGAVDAPTLETAYVLDKEAEALRWFYFPSEPTSTASVFPGIDRPPSTCIIIPKVYRQGGLGSKKNEKTTHTKVVKKGRLLRRMLSWSPDAKTTATDKVAVDEIEDLSTSTACPSVRG